MRISDWSSDVCSSDLMHRRRGEHAGDRDAIRPDIFVGEENLALALAHRLFGLVADALDRGAQRLRPAPGFEGALDLGRGGGEMRLEPIHVSARDRMIDGSGKSASQRESLGGRSI